MEIRRADPIARRHAVRLLIAGTILGTLLIAAFARYRGAIRNGLGSDPRATGDRVKLMLVVLAGLLSAPVVAFALYFWMLGTRILRMRQFPPPGFPVVRDTAVLDGMAAARRGHGFRALAIGLGLATLVLWVLLWRLARTLAPGVL